MSTSKHKRTMLSGNPGYICAWQPQDEHGWLCNFSIYPIVIDGKTWPSVEHYYQSQKFQRDPSVVHQILAEPDPAKAKAIAHRSENTHLIREDWATYKEIAMRVGLRAKIEQHPYLAQRLIETGDMHIVEDSPMDYYWGCGEKGTGLNRLGTFWEEIRDELRR